MKFRISTLLLMIALVGVILGWAIDSAQHQQDILRIISVESALSSASASGHVYDLIDNCSAGNLKLAREVSLLSHFAALSKMEGQFEVSGKIGIEEPNRLNETAALVLHKLGIQNSKQLEMMIENNREHLLDLDIFTQDKKLTPGILAFSKRVLSND